MITGTPRLSLRSWLSNKNTQKGSSDKGELKFGSTRALEQLVFQRTQSSGRLSSVRKLRDLVWILTKLLNSLQNLILICSILSWNKTMIIIMMKMWKCHQIQNLSCQLLKAINLLNWWKMLSRGQSWSTRRILSFVKTFIRLLFLASILLKRFLTKLMYLRRSFDDARIKGSWVLFKGQITMLSLEK